MAQSQRSTSSNKKAPAKGAAKKTAASGQTAKTAKAKARPAAERERASSSASEAGRARAATRVRSSAAPEEQARRPYAPAHAPLLDAAARHDIAGVVVAILGVAMLIAVLAPSTGVLTLAVSDGLHAVLGLGAFVLPVALIVWAVTFFVNVQRIEPGRAAVGGLLIIVAVLGIFGLLTPGCVDDPSRLFNAYVLADRGGYVGNGVAWVLLALVGKVVGIVLLCGVALAGVIVVGFSARDFMYDCMERAAYSRAQARMRSEERAASRRRSQAAIRAYRAGYDGRDEGYDYEADGYAPTALFDPSRPLARQEEDVEAFDDRRPARARSTERVASGRGRSATVVAQVPAGPTVELGEDFAGGYAPVREPSRVRVPSGEVTSWGTVPASVARTPEERAAWIDSVTREAYARAGEEDAPAAVTSDPSVTGRHFAVAADTAGEDFAWDGAANVIYDGAASAVRAAAEPEAPAPVEQTIQPQVELEPQPEVETAPEREGEGTEPETPAAAPSFLQRKRERRVQRASQWWDPADDWNREDWDDDLAYGTAEPVQDGGAYVPGVLPGAPCSFDDELDGVEEDRQVEEPLCGGAAFDEPAEEGASARLSGLHVVEAPAAPALSILPEPAVPAPVVAARPAVPAVAPVLTVLPEPEPAPAPAPAPGFSAAAVPAAKPAAASSGMHFAPVAPAAPSRAALPWEDDLDAADADDEMSAYLDDEGIASPVDATPLPQAALDTRPSVAQPASAAAAEFTLPDPGIFHRSAAGFARSEDQRREASEMAERLQSTLSEFGVRAEVVKWVEGPTCTTYMVSPGEGVRVSRFTALEDDIARALARTSVRIYAPVPGTSYVGIEVSSNNRQSVAFGDVLPYVNGGPLDLAIGLDANGEPVHSDLAKLPHLLIAGTTGSGKSVMMNTIIMSLLMRDTPDDVRLIMVDPKQVEFSVYAGIPHLVMPVVADPRQAAAALQWAVTEMDRRYRLFSNMGVRDLASYNRLVQSDAFELSENPPRRLPALVVIIDELADLMMVAKKDVEGSIVRIAQLGRACGIHLVMATQTPRADIVTGLIRANVANRIALRVSKGVDSKIIIDQTGAEKLLPHGDMLFLEAGWSDKPRRIQGCFLSDDEIRQVVDHLKAQQPPSDLCNMAPLPGAKTAGSFEDPAASGGKAGNDDDPLAWEAAKLVVDTQMGSTSLVQRRLKLGYARAGRVMDMLEEMGIVGPAKGSKPRDVLVRDLDELETLRGTFDDLDEEY